MTIELRQREYIYQIDRHDSVENDEGRCVKKRPRPRGGIEKVVEFDSVFRESRMGLFSVQIIFFL